MATTLNITLKKSGKSDFEYLVVDGAADKYSSVFKNPKGLLHAHIYDESLINKLRSLRVEDLEQYFASLGIPHNAGWDGRDNIEIRLWSHDGKKKKRQIQFQLQPNADHWARPYSLAEYAEAFQNAVNNLALPGIRYFEEDEIISNGVGIRCRVVSGNPVVNDELDRLGGMLKNVQAKTEELLLTTTRKNAVTTFFRFPAAVRTACEQYLIYFVQFLEDLGIKAETEIKEDARRVLFSVTPQDGPGALEKVRQALEVYLRLPSTPNFGTAAGQYPDLAVQQLHANVLHLQSQLMLAKVSLQAQDATIEVLRLSNYQYRQLISSEEKPKAQTEALIGDTVHVTKIEGKGLKIDLPLILKRLKRVLGIGKRIDV
jgi:hypothetical protein